MVETETRSNRRLAGFRTICAHAYILVVVQRAQRLKFGQILLSTDMCQIASSYAFQAERMYRKFNLLCGAYAG